MKMLPIIEQENPKTSKIDQLWTLPRLPVSMRVLLIVTLFVTFSNSVTSQSSEWKLIEDSEDNFLVAVPSTFKYKRNKFLGRFVGGRGEYSEGKVYLFVFVDPRKNADQVETVEKFLSINRVSPQSIRVGSTDGIVYRFEDEDGYHHAVLRIVTATRTYAFHALSRSSDDTSVDRFINSVRVSSVPFTDAQKTDALPPSLVSKEDNKETSGDSTIKPLDPPNPTPSPQFNEPGSSRIPLRVISTQKAQYSDFAKFYMIEGTVTVRVMFLHDGTIGEIKVIKGLPFGLIAAAKLAARQIKFNPEILDSKSVTISKPVAYTFNIY